MRCRYRRYTDNPAKGRLLDEFCQVTGHERNYATKLLSRRRGPNGGDGCAPSRGERPPTYGAEVAEVLQEICGTRRSPAASASGRCSTCGCRPTRDAKERFPSESAKRFSPSARRKLTGCGHRTRSVWGIVNRRAEGQRDDRGAGAREGRALRREGTGWIEADTVAHCGGDMGESFLWSLAATDIFGGWTEVRVNRNRSQNGVPRGSSLSLPRLRSSLAATQASACAPPGQRDQPESSTQPNPRIS